MYVRCDSGKCHRECLICIINVSDFVQSTAGLSVYSLWRVLQQSFSVQRHPASLFPWELFQVPLCLLSPDLQRQDGRYAATEKQQVVYTLGCVGLNKLCIHFPLRRLYQRQWLWIRKVEALWKKTCLFSTYNRNAGITTWWQRVHSDCICSCKISGGKNLS